MEFNCYNEFLHYMEKSNSHKLSFSTEERMPYGFVNDNRIFIFCCLVLSAHNENTYASSNKHESGK